MRYVLAVALILPLLAQQAEEKKPEPPAAAAQAEAKPAAQAEAKPAAPAEAKPAAQAEAKPAESPAPTPPVEQSIAGSLDLGYRWRSDVSGSFNTYRSIVNLGEGPKISGWDFS